jgi:hypothetical protein
MSCGAPSATGATLSTGSTTAVFVSPGVLGEHPVLCSLFPVLCSR